MPKYPKIKIWSSKELKAVMNACAFYLKHGKPDMKEEMKVIDFYNKGKTYFKPPLSGE